ncbi:pyrroline-5-carboxylate reductase family protein [Clostridium sp. WILCCON 0269]|uniref:Pyrroline-5-carboxylate reductase family protein n=1 Tax=Candidatus Clostridium eludens TaxID=3381663 RepID=A0ABW8SIB4_9CLOT
MKIGIIGFGHLGKALTKGLIYKKIVSKDEIFILAKSAKTKDIAQKEFGVQACSDINDIIEKANIIFWVLKGNVFVELSNDIQQDITHKIHVSFMAGMPITSIRQKLGDVFIIRAMPNIAIDRADGVIGYTKTNSTFVKKIFSELGYAFEIEEKDIEKVTAFSACGLGFAAYILNAFQKVGQAFEFSSEVSEKIVAKTFNNAIDMSDYEGTVNAVATKGGATEQGIICFTENNLNRIVSEAMNKAYDKMR